jgi:uncharacterized repeat protein (TIGR03847 family)
VVRRQFVFDPPDRFVAGTIGQPGNRTFFLQARDGRRVVSVSLEKTQVAVLAERLGRLLVELERRGIASVPATPTPDVAPLDEPLNEAFRAGSLTLGWDGDDDMILIEARDLTDEDDEEGDEEAEEATGDEEAMTGELDDDQTADLFRVRISLGAARAFVERAIRVVEAGRPPCPLCGNPLDPQGHLCPRKNGHYVH